DESAGIEAYLNTYITYNAAWLDSAWGTSARADGHYDTAIVTDAKGTILFGESVRGPLTGSIGNHYRGATAILGYLDAAAMEFGDSARIAHLAEGGGRDAISAVAAAVIHGATSQFAVPADQRRILWLAKQMDDTMLGEIARLFQVPVPRLA